MRNLKPGSEVIARRYGSTEQDLTEYESHVTLCGERIDETWEIYRWPEGKGMDDYCGSCLQVSMNR